MYRIILASSNTYFGHRRRPQAVFICSILFLGVWSCSFYKRCVPSHGGYYVMGPRLQYLAFSMRLYMLHIIYLLGCAHFDTDPEKISVPLCLFYGLLHSTHNCTNEYDSPYAFCILYTSFPSVSFERICIYTHDTLLCFTILYTHMRVWALFM